MKKTTGILVAVVAVAVAYTGASWFTGKQARQAIEQAVTQANQRMSQALVGQPAAGSGATLAVAEYRQRIFSSDVVYSLRVHDEPGQEYLLSDHLQHGPFPLAAITAGNLRPMMALSQSRLLPSAATQAWFDSLNGQSPLTGRTQVHFGGSAVSDWTFLPLAVAQDGEVLKFSGGAIHAALDNDFADSKVQGSFEALDLSTETGAERVTIDDLQFEYETTSTGNQANMQSTMHIAGVNLRFPDGDLSLKDSTLTASSQREGDLGGGSMRYDFGKVMSGGVDLGSISLGARGSDFSMPALSELADVYDELSARHGPQDEWQLSAAEASLLQGKLLALLASAPTVALDPVTWKNDQGESRATLVVELVSPPHAGEGLSLDQMLQQAVRALDLTLHVEKPMFMRAIEQIDAGSENSEAAAIAATLYDEYAGRLQAAGLASVTDQAASAAISYREGQVEANGRQMSLPEFMQRALLVFFM